MQDAMKLSFDEAMLFLEMSRIDTATFLRKLEIPLQHIPLELLHYALRQKWTWIHDAHLKELYSRA